MAQEYAASVTASVIRITRLSSDGTVTTGPSASYVSKSFISVSMTPEYEEGEEFTQKNAAGEVCVTYKAPDTLKRVNLSIAICNPDPFFTNIATGGELLGDGAGWAAPEIGKNALPNGVAVEVWSNAIIDGKPAPSNPYFHWLFPYATLRQGGERVIENGMLATSFEGWAVGNTGFADGPGSPAWAYPTLTDRAYAYARSATAPSAVGYAEVPAV